MRRSKDWEVLEETDINPCKKVSVAALRHHIAKLQAELMKSRVQYSSYSRAHFGRWSEKQEKDHPHASVISNPAPRDMVTCQG